MYLPDYTTADTALTALAEPHGAQHRCTDGRYYTPRETALCPVNVRLGVLRTTLDHARSVAHRACHDTAHITAVAEGMTGLTMSELESEDREGWMLATRHALETHAALLDGVTAEQAVQR